MEFQKKVIQTSNNYCVLPFCAFTSIILYHNRNFEIKSNKMAPTTRKSLSFLTLKPSKVSNSKENSFLYRLSDFSSTINRRRSMRLSTLANNFKNIVSFNRKFCQFKINLFVNNPFLTNRKSHSVKKTNNQFTIDFKKSK